MLAIRCLLPALFLLPGLGMTLVFGLAGDAKAATARVFLENRTSEEIRIKITGAGATGRYSLDVLRPRQRKWYTAESTGARFGMWLEQTGSGPGTSWITRNFLNSGRHYVIPAPGRVEDVGPMPLVVIPRR